MTVSGLTSDDWNVASTVLKMPSAFSELQLKSNVDTLNEKLYGRSDKQDWKVENDANMLDLRRQESDLGKMHETFT
jgi:hypothetical protein